MKKLLAVLAIVMPMALLAQQTPVDKLFDKYANQDGFTTVNISGTLLGFAAQMGDEDDETSDMLSSVKGIRVLTVDDSALNKKLDFYQELEDGGLFKNKSFEVLMEVTEKDEVVRFIAKDMGNGNVSDFLLVVGGDDNVIISISGVIKTEDIGKVTKSLNVNVGDLEE